jgi:hypothetical protein
MLLVSQGTSPSVNEAETEAQITSQTNLGTGMRANALLWIEVTSISLFRPVFDFAEKL